MIILDMTPQEVQTIINGCKHLGNGCFGLVVKLDEDTLFKFNYKDFFDCFEQKDRKVQLDKLGDITREIEIRKDIAQILYNGEPTKIQHIKKMIARQDKVKLSTLTQGLVYSNGFCIGYILKNHKNMKDLYPYMVSRALVLTQEEKEHIMKQIKERLDELFENHIYVLDFSLNNMLYDKQTRTVELIDFEDSLYCLDKRDENFEKEILHKYQKMCSFWLKPQEKEII